jgi:transposase
MNCPAHQDDRVEKTKNDPIEATPPRDLDVCPRCGYFIGTITWGKTNCPNCGLHFECC